MPEQPLRNQPLLTEPELRARLSELYDAIDQFNRRYYFESHETLEDLWMVTPSPEREFMQGIIQLAAAFVHFARREYPGIFKLLDASSDKLERFAPSEFGVDVASLLPEIARVRSELEALGEDRFAQLGEARVPVIAYERGQ